MAAPAAVRRARDTRRRRGGSPAMWRSRRTICPTVWRRPVCCLPRGQSDEPLRACCPTRRSGRQCLARRWSAVHRRRRGQTTRQGLAQERERAGVELRHLALVRDRAQEHHHHRGHAPEVAPRPGHPRATDRHGGGCRERRRGVGSTADPIRGAHPHSTNLALRTFDEPLTVLCRDD
jgi:hypothetical protein